jgi:soluble lytic murein transglycosylase-like protein
LHTKYYVSFILRLLPALLAACLTLPSYAQDSVDAVHPSEVNEKSATSIEQIDIEKAKAELEAMAHLKAALSKEPKTDTVVEEEKNPYEQLVKLAFKGKGTNGVESYKQAAKLYCKKAKEENDANAEFALGWMYANGRGLDKDENVAALFFNKAAAQGHTKAKQWLADINGDETQATVPSCFLPDPPPQVAKTNELAPPGSNGEVFYEKGPIFEMVNRLAPEFHIETDLAMAFIKVESNFNPKATSPKNAQGLMQLIPATSKRFNVKNPYNPEDNIKGGLAYLQWLLAYYEGDVRLVAAAYNAGENAVDRYKGVPPYPETRRYVSKIYTLYKKSFHPFRDDLLLGQKSGIIQVSSNP